jgi:branched-chain amino acid transport system substrate-binding protein
MRRLATIFACISVLAFGAVPRSAGAVDPYQVSVILPQTGAMAFVGKGELQAIKLVEGLENKAGGIKGQPIEFVGLDDQSDPKVAVQLLNGVIAKRAPVVIGSTLLAICNAEVALAKEGPVILCLSNGSEPAVGSYMYSMGVHPLSMVQAALRYFRGRGLTKIALISSTDATGIQGDGLFDTALKMPENASVTLAAHEHFATTDLSVAAQIARVRASGAQAIVAWTSGTPFGTVLRGISEAGLEMPVMTSYANSTYAQMDAYKAFLPKEALFIAPPSLAAGSGLPNGPHRRAIGEFTDALKTVGMRPEVGTNNGWDPAKIVIAALRRYGPSMTADQMRTFLNTTRSWVGIGGDYNWVAVPQRGLGANGTMIQRWDPGSGGWIGVSKLGGEPLATR